MCNLGMGILDEGIQIGEKRGEKRGEKKGIFAGLLSAIHALMNNKNISIETAMDDLSIPFADRQKYALAYAKEYPAQNR